MRQVIEGRRTLAGILAVALLLSGCTTSHPLNVDPSQIHDLGPDEGIVFGSLLVEIAPEGPRFGQRTEGFRYRLNMMGPGPSPPESYVDLVLPDREDLFDEEWELLVSPGEERTFVARLPAGDQVVGALRPKAPFPRLGFAGEFDILASFRVTAGEVTYIGRLVLVLPKRLNIHVAAHVRVEDGLVTAQAALGGDYGERFESPRVALINLMSGRAMMDADPRPGEPGC